MRAEKLDLGNTIKRKFETWHSPVEPFKREFNEIEEKALRANFEVTHSWSNIDAEGNIILGGGEYAEGMYYITETDLSQLVIDYKNRTWNQTLLENDKIIHQANILIKRRKNKKILGFIFRVFLALAFVFCSFFFVGIITGIFSLLIVGLIIFFIKFLSIKPFNP